MVKKISPFLLLLLCAVISCGHEEPSNRIDPSELLKNGYKYIIFGSQNTDGIELYDLENKTFLSFLRKNGQRLTHPIIDNTGTGYFLRNLGDIFERDKNFLTVFDLKKRPLKNDKEFHFPRGSSKNIALSPDKSRIAFTCYDSDSKAWLRIYNVKTGTLEKSIPIQDSFFGEDVKIVWKPDNNSVVLWERDEIRPACEVNISTGTTKRLILFYYPLNYFQDKFELLKKREDNGIYLKDLKRNRQYKLKGKWHSIKFSRDGKYCVAGRQRGKGFETLVIIDTYNLERTLQIEIKDHAGTALGIDLW